MHDMAYAHLPHAFGFAPMPFPLEGIARELDGLASRRKRLIPIDCRTTRGKPSHRAQHCRSFGFPAPERTNRPALNRTLFQACSNVVSQYWMGADFREQLVPRCDHLHDRSMEENRLPN